MLFHYEMWNKNLDLCIEDINEGDGSYEWSKQDSALENSKRNSKFFVDGHYRLFVMNEW